MSWYAFSITCPHSFSCLFWSLEIGLKKFGNVWPPAKAFRTMFSLIASVIVLTKQESPPAWTQEAYHLLCGHSNFLLFWGGGIPWQKFFSPVWTCIKPNLVSKIFPFTGGVPQENFFSPVWTCIKPNLVSKIFPFTGGALRKFFFPSLNMYQAKSGVKNFSLYWDWVPSTQKSETWDPPENLRPGTPQKSETWDPLPKIWDLGPPQKSETWDPPWKSETWDPPEQTHNCENITSHHTYVRGGNKSWLAYDPWGTEKFISFFYSSIPDQSKPVC